MLGTPCLAAFDSYIMKYFYDGITLSPDEAARNGVADSMTLLDENP